MWVTVIVSSAMVVAELIILKGGTPKGCGRCGRCKEGEDSEVRAAASRRSSSS